MLAFFSVRVGAFAQASVETAKVAPCDTSLLDRTTSLSFYLFRQYTNKTRLVGSRAPRFRHTLGVENYFHYFHSRKRAITSHTIKPAFTCTCEVAVYGHPAAGLLINPRQGQECRAGRAARLKLRRCRSVYKRGGNGRRDESSDKSVWNLIYSTQNSVILGYRKSGGFWLGFVFIALAPGLEQFTTVNQCKALSR